MCIKNFGWIETGKKILKMKEGEEGARCTVWYV